ncbi:MAG: carbon storage regulator [Planctomycetaceae bacterium]
MLVLTRRRSEMIRIGEDIVIKVIKSGRNSVKIGIDAPADVRVLRAELVDRDAQSLAVCAGDRAPCAPHFGR